MISKVRYSHQNPHRHKAEQRLARDRAQPPHTPSPPTHPPSNHSSDSFFSLPNLLGYHTPTAWEHLAPLTPRLGLLCAQTLQTSSHSPVFDFPAYKLDHTAHRDH